MKLKRKHNYVVAFEGEGRCIYGQDVFSEEFDCNVASYTQPMTILQAIRQLKSLSDTKKVVYKLVKVDPKEEKFRQKILNQMVIK